MGLFSFFRKNNGLYPESKWVVDIKNEELISINYQKEVMKFPINSIKKIVIETNDSGPWGTDLWWKVFSIQEEPMIIPNGATGESEMIEKFEKIEGFSNDALAKAMSCVLNAEFICLDRQT